MNSQLNFNGNFSSENSFYQNYYEMNGQLDPEYEAFCSASDYMTKEELEDPEIMTAERVDRVCQGSGLSTKEVRELLKQYRQSKKMMKMMKGSGDVNKMMKKKYRTEKCFN